MGSGGLGWPRISARRDRGYPRVSDAGGRLSPRLSEPASAGLWLELLVIVPAGGCQIVHRRRGDFEVQQVQQNHKRPCLQEVSEFLKVQQKCNMKCNKVQQWQRKRSIQYSVKISKLAYACLRLPTLA